MTVKYTEDHEWVLIEGDKATVGITDYAQNALGDIVFVDLPEVGSEFEQGDDCAVVESVKAASEVYAPLNGEILEINEDLEDNPGLVNSAAEDDAWFFKMSIADPSQLDDLMDEDGYKAFCDDLD